MNHNQGSELNVLFVAHYTDLYGANFSLLQLMLELRPKGVRPTVLLPEKPVASGRNLVDELDLHGIPYIKAPIWLVKSPSRIKAVPNYLLAMSGLKPALSRLEGMNFDLVHSNSSTIATGAYIAKKLGVPHVWHIREFGDLDYNLRTPFGKWFQKAIYSGNNTFVAISEKIRNHYSPYIGTQEIRLIYNGIKPMPTRDKDAAGNIINFCIVGLLQPKKCQIDVLKAVDLLANQRNVGGFRLVVVGDGDPSYTQALKDFIEEKHLGNFVDMAGRIDNVPELLAKMDVGVVASSHEAFGRVTVEYMLAGMCVIASDGGANLEIIEDGVNGLIYHGGDVAQLADRMQSLIQDPKLMGRLSDAGKLHAQKHFTSAANSEAIYNLYLELLSDKKSLAVNS